MRPCMVGEIGEGELKAMRMALPLWRFSTRTKMLRYLAFEMLRERQWCAREHLVCQKALCLNQVSVGSSAIVTSYQTRIFNIVLT